MDLVEKLINEGIKRGVFPGASLLVARGSEILYEKTAGQAQMEPSPRLLKKNTLFDISSLTKPIATATLYMLVWQEKKIELDAPAKSFFPKITESYTIRQLLNHTSGLPDWRPYYKSVKNKTGLIEKIIFEPLLSTPGEKVLYSDLGYILLGNILENIYKKNLDELFDKKVAEPLNMKQTFFISNPPHPPLKKGGVLEFPPLKKGGEGGFSFAATENCAWRKKMICGEVMDEHAWVLGGVAGHAGLFSTARDILRWIVELDASRHGKSRLIDRKTFELFCRIPLKRDPTKIFFTLGFDTPSTPSSAGIYFSRISLGHLGYSGCSFWWDLDKNLVVIFLTNRVHPTRKNNQIKEFRPKLHDAIMQFYGS